MHSLFSTIKKVQADIEKRDRDQKITDLEAKIRQMRATETIQHVAQLPLASGQVVINGKFFSVVRAGMLMAQEERNVSLGGKT